MMTLLLLILALQARAPREVDVSSLAPSAPQLVCQLDMNVLKGEVRRLSWSPDGSRVAFLQRDSRRIYRVMVTSISRSSS